MDRHVIRKYPRTPTRVRPGRVNPATAAPTRYRIEGFLFRAAAREGAWSVERGATTVYRLDAAGGAGMRLWLFDADDGVVFASIHRTSPSLATSISATRCTGANEAGRRGAGVTATGSDLRFVR